MLIKNATIVNYNQTLNNADILIKDGIFSKIQTGINADNEEIINGENLHVFPGFVDLHCHLRDPGLTHKEDIESGSLSAASGGFTTICCMPNTLPPVDNINTLNYIIDTAKNQAYTEVLPVACITKEMKGAGLTDFSLLQAAVAFSDDGLPVMKEEILVKAMQKAKELNKILMLHEEDIPLRKNGEVNLGEYSIKAGLKGIPREVEDNLTNRDVDLALEHNMPVHICHVSTKGSVDIIRKAKSKGARVTCETTPHYFTLDDSLLLNYTPLLKVNPPIRDKSDVLAVIEGIKDGTIDAIATDHAPHTKEEKAMKVPLFGMIGFETAFSLGYKYLVMTNHIALNTLINLMCKAPADIIQIKRGVISEGEVANLCIWDLATEYTYKEENIVSKSKNSPFIDYKMQGKLKCTIVKGEVKYDNRQPN